MPDYATIIGMGRLLEGLTDLDNLWLAWHDVRRKNSAPGLDGVSVAEFAPHAPAHLKVLRRELRCGDYRPQSLLGVSIPKADNGGWRKIGIPAVRDRVAQRACLNLLEPILDPELEDCSYAYRAGRSIYGALAQIERWRDRGHRVLLDADIENCFDSIDRDRLMDVLRCYVVEPEIIALVRLWLEAGVVWPQKRDDVSPLPRIARIAPCGIPQGQIISPLLCNLFLDGFDEALLGRNFKLVRYADDLVVLTTDREKAIEAQDATREALDALGLRLHRRKTRIADFERGFRYLGAVFVGDLMLPTVPRASRVKRRIGTHLRARLS
jgi:group II intron reverse transcriptase/maturase